MGGRWAVHFGRAGERRAGTGSFVRRMRRHFTPFAAVAACAVALAACHSSPTFTPPAAAPSAVPTLPPSFPPEDIVGRWGYAAYHQEVDRTRTEKNAQSQCNKPVVINRGPSGGVMMYLADDPKLTELRLKGHPNGKTYIGPDGEPGAQQDREVVTFDGRILILRWVDPEVASRYGTSVYVRCGARA
jgi:hypothetical protein